MSLEIEHTVENGRIVIQLDHPIEAGDKVIGELRFRRPKVGDLRGLDWEEDEVGATLDFAARLCGVASPVLGEMEMVDDWPRVQKVVAFFFKRRSQTDGSTV